MASRNGYFQVMITDKITCIRVYPPVDGGEAVRADELRDYLNNHGFNVDVVLLKNLIDAATDGPRDLKLADKKIIPISESMKITVSADKMTAVVRFYPFSSAGSAYTMEDIKSDLLFNGIKSGIDEQEISRFLHDKYYCTDYVLAKGMAPINGVDAHIEYYFNTNPNLKPKLNDDGTVDFFSLSAISKVTEGQKLATLTKEVLGEPGFDVTGEIIMPREVKRLALKYGRNIQPTDDGMSIVSTVNGHATLVDDKVFVSNVYEVSDVDTGTGNIEYDGDVCVLGNVRAGFSMKVKGNVEVRGVVEGALIEASGNVSIARGMNGMGKGKIIAGGNVVAKFFENTEVEAGGYVHAEAIMHSKITAKNDVEVTGKRGFITGGVIRTETIVKARTLGSTMGADTEIEVGIDPKIKIRMNSLSTSLAGKRKKFAQVVQVVETISKKIKAGDTLTPSQVLYFKQLSEEYKSLKEEIDKESLEYSDLLELMDGKGTESYVAFEDFAYPGVRLSISDALLTLDKPVQHGRFVKDGADVRVKGY